MKKELLAGSICLGVIDDCEETKYTFTLDHNDGTREEYRLIGFNAVQNASIEHYFSKERATAVVCITKGWLAEGEE